MRDRRTGGGGGDTGGEPKGGQQAVLDPEHHLPDPSPTGEALALGTVGHPDDRGQVMRRRLEVGGRGRAGAHRLMLAWRPAALACGCRPFEGGEHPC